MLIAVIISFGISATIPLACKSDQSVMDVSPSELPDKGNPKLDSQLNQLVIAEARGEVAEFAENHGIELVNGDVRVIIECLPGQLETASLEMANAGARIETSHDNLLQVIVPITSLDSLAEASSIRFIRLPQLPLPAITNGGK